MSILDGVSFVRLSDLEPSTATEEEERECERAFRRGALMAFGVAHRLATGRSADVIWRAFEALQARMREPGRPFDLLDRVERAARGGRRV